MNNLEAEAGSAGTALVTVDYPDEHAELAEIDGLLTETDEEPSVDSGRSAGLRGGFGFAGLALAVVSLTTNWTSGVVVSHGQYSGEIHAPSTGLSAQQQLNMAVAGWHTQGWWALVFAAAAVVCGAGAMLWPSARRSDNPGWARAAATGAVIVGLVGAILAVLTITGVFGGHLTAPAA